MGRPSSPIMNDSTNKDEVAADQVGCFGYKIYFVKENFLLIQIFRKASM